MVSYPLHSLVVLYLIWHVIALGARPVYRTLVLGYRVGYGSLEVF
jgi:hypothetical protein